MTFDASGPLSGTARVPGDKSISHRALMLTAMARGRSRIHGLSEGADVASTAAALAAMGARIERDADGVRIVDGVGTGCLLQPEAALDMGNSGTSARLLAGLIASHPIQATLTGDASLSRRPMGRVIEPLSRIGAEFIAAPGGRLPLTIKGLCPAVPREQRLRIASAQVKSALLLAGLNTPGRTRVIEPVPTRDHSERMLKRFGAAIRVTRDGSDTIIDLDGEAELIPQDLIVPGDPSAAAFLVTAALIVPGSEVRLEGIGINPLRIGYFDVLKAMGADLEIANEREEAGEPVADLVARHSPLKGVDVPPEAAAGMIDEFPIFFVAAAFAQGTSRASGLEELRVKESDRIAVMAEGLGAIGARVEEQADGMILHGSGGAPLAGGATIAARLDHRIAMSFAVAALACRNPITIDDMAPVDTSFPGFAATLAGLAA
jgi:3-phosphoshikimate 1-carboxyvinyltransferase